MAITFARLCAALPLLLAAACRPPTAAPSASAAPAPTTASAALGEVVFQGMCDASAAVSLDERRFAVADDEDNVLRVFDAERGGPPLAAVDLSPALGLRSKKKAKETDLEGATRIGDRAYWITSHGRSSSGKLRPERLRFFATTVAREDDPIALVGVPCTTLLEQLIAEPSLARFALGGAAARAPKEPGGLAIEGLAATEDGRALIGFRNPVPEGRALLVPLENPREVTDGARARFGAPLRLDLGGLGVRALAYFQGRYLIAAGPISEGPARLYSWSGAPAEAPAPVAAFNDFAPEAFVTSESRRVMVLSDDGGTLVDGEPCKSLKDPARRRFRGRWLTR